MDFMEKLESKIDALTKSVNDLTVSLAGRCAREEVRMCRVELDIDRAFVKMRGIWGWVVSGIGFVTTLLTLFYFLLSAKVKQ
jgi:hypothetical protein